MRTGELRFVSENEGGEPGDFDSRNATVTADGRHVVFSTVSTNLLEGDTNNRRDVFLKDLETGSVTRLSVGPDNLQGSRNSDGPIITPDGRVVVFWSQASEFTPNDFNGWGDVFRLELGPPTGPLLLGIDNDQVPENQPPGTVIATFSTVDGESDSHTYELAAGEGAADNSAFEIIGDQLRARSSFDFEVRTALSIRVRTTNAAGHSLEQAFSLAVTDGPEGAPTNGLIGGVAWTFAPDVNALTLQGLSTVSDAISLGTADVAGLGTVITVQANGVAAAFDGTGGRPILYVNEWNHLQSINVDGHGGHDSISLAALPAGAYAESLLVGDLGNDTIVGGLGRDTLRGGLGVDRLDGGPEADTYQIQGTLGQFDLIEDSGTDGDDVLVNGAAGPFDLRGFGPASGLEILDGGGQALRGDAAANVIDFRSTSLRNLLSVTGLGGNDTIFAAADAPAGPAAFTGYFGGAGNDTLVGGAGADPLFGESGNDSLSGLGGNDQLFGGPGNDRLDGGEGDDELTGAVGQDTQLGGDGSDTYFAVGTDAQFDVLTDTGAAGIDALVNAGGKPLVLRSFLPNNGLEAVDGNGFSLRGDGAHNTFDFRAIEMRRVRRIETLGGNDTIFGTDLAMVDGASFEGYFGGLGSDSLTAGALAARLFGEAGNDKLTGGSGDDTLVGSTGLDTLTGGPGDDVFFANQISGTPLIDDANQNGIDDDEEGLVLFFTG